MRSEKYQKKVYNLVLKSLPEFLKSGILLEYIVSRSQHKEHVATTSSSIHY